MLQLKIKNKIVQIKSDYGIVPTTTNGACNKEQESISFFSYSACPQINSKQPELLN